MPINPIYKSAFAPNNYYHLIFKSLDGIILFYDQENRDFFLRKFKFFLGSVCNCWAYCQLINHTHFVIKIRAIANVYELISSIPVSERTAVMEKWLINCKVEPLFDELIERQINRFMVSYVNAYNNRRKRKGGLFQSPFKRLLIEGESYLKQAIIYVHANAQKHGVVNDFRLYPHSSYLPILQKTSSIVNGPEVLNFFDGENKFIEQHKIHVDTYYPTNSNRLKFDFE